MAATNPTSPAGGGEGRSEGAPPFADFRDVFLAYEGHTDFAVEDITLSIQPGEFVAIVGPSGCGKSTFMKLATGLKPPTRGTVTVEGARVTGPLKIVGMAFQAPTLLPWRRTLDNVLLPLEIVEPYRSTFKRDREQFADRARALLKTVGLDGSKVGVYQSFLRNIKLGIPDGLRVDRPRLRTGRGHSGRRVLRLRREVPRDRIGEPAVNARGWSR